MVYERIQASNQENFGSAKSVILDSSPSWLDYIQKLSFFPRAMLERYDSAINNILPIYHLFGRKNINVEHFSKGSSYANNHNTLHLEILLANL